MSKVEGVASCNYFFFEASRVKSSVKTFLFKQAFG